MICGIVLAAGRSKRMGRQKLLLPFGSSTVIRRVVDAFLGSGVDSMTVVVRPDDEGVRGALAGRTLTFTANPDLEGDMLSSLRCGLCVLPQAADIIVVSPGDQPSLQPELMRQMLAAFKSECPGI